mmetsp:Transcript_40926/g.80695  ORF Transcript_40926/g.80695 Transcript_40926/m.80695 type:complete len:96 (-) Transcript_40926:2116-2403(-)
MTCVWNRTKVPPRLFVDFFHFAVFLSFPFDRSVLIFLALLRHHSIIFSMGFFHFTLHAVLFLQFVCTHPFFSLLLTDTFPVPCVKKKSQTHSLVR